jgi:DNA-binding beta-propeller fold protein YncE
MSPFLWSQFNAKIINLATNNLNSDPVSKRIYASVPGAPGNIAPIDPTTGTTGTAIPVGNGPTKLAGSDNGQFLYIGLDGEAAVQRVTLATQTAGLKLSLCSELSFGPFFV